MRAIILAAGLGKRMLPLTADRPKPLLEVGGRSLIEHQVDRLVKAGIQDIVINHFYLGEQIEQQLGDGSRYGASIHYSRETERLETAGGIIRALPLLKEDRFVVVNSDIWTDYDFSRLGERHGQRQEGADSMGGKERQDGKPGTEDSQAHLVMVNNAPHHPAGDFLLDEKGYIHEGADIAAGFSADDAARNRLTFSGISLLHRALFEGMPEEPLPLLPVLRRAMEAGRVSGEHYSGTWIDIGTPERLAELNRDYQPEL